MADIRIKDLATTASVTASDDFMAVDGTTNGTRKLSAATPAFLTSVTTPSLTSPASTNLTLGLGTGGTALTLTNSTLAATFAGAVTVTGNGTFSGNGATLTFTGTGSPTITASNSDLKITATAASADIIIDAYRNEYHKINGTTRGLWSSSGLDITGAVTISSTTAGAANAGALVLQGGISAGNTGSAASYFGGAVTVTGAVTSQQTRAAVLQSFTGNPISGNVGVNGDINQLTLKVANTAGGNTEGVALKAVLNGVLSNNTTLILAGDNGAGTLVDRLTLTNTTATFAGTVIAPAATASLAPLRIPHGTAPTSPTDGDMWSTTAGLFIRINGVTKTVTLI